jgi:hypothetical protein
MGPVPSPCRTEIAVKPRHVGYLTSSTHLDQADKNKIESDGLGEG